MNDSFLILQDPPADFELSLDDIVFVVDSSDVNCERVFRFSIRQLQKLFSTDIVIPVESVGIKALNAEVLRFIIHARLADGTIPQLPIDPNAPQLPIDPNTPQTPQTPGIPTPNTPTQPNLIPGNPISPVPMQPPVTRLLPPPQQEVLNKIVRYTGTPRVPPPADAVAPVLSVPNQARDLTVIERDRELLLTFLDPSDDGGSAILKFYVAIHLEEDTIDPEDLVWIDIGLSRSHKFSNLDNTKSYLMYVRPENSVGFGFASTIVGQPVASAAAETEVSAELRIDNLVYTYNPRIKKFKGKNLRLLLGDSVTGLSADDFTKNNLVIRHLNDQRGTLITTATGNQVLSNLFFINVTPFTEDETSLSEHSGEVSIQLPAAVATSQDNRGNAQSNKLTFKYVEYSQVKPPHAEGLIVTSASKELTVQWKKQNDDRIEGYVFSLRQLPDIFELGKDDPKDFIYTTYGVSTAGLSLYGGIGERVAENKQRFVGLENGVAYAIEVIPYNEFGNPDADDIAMIAGVPSISPENLAVPVDALPSPPTSLASFLTANGRFRVTWERPLKPNFTGFRVRVNNGDWVVLGADVRHYDFGDTGINTYELQTINTRGHSDSVFIREQFIGGSSPNLQGFRLEAGNRVVKVSFDPIPQPKDLDLSRFSYSAAFISAFKIVGGIYADNTDFVTGNADGVPFFYVNLENDVEYEITGRVEMSAVSGGSGNNFPSPEVSGRITPSASHAASNAPGEPTASVTVGDGQLTIDITPPSDDGGGHGIEQYNLNISPVPLDSRGFPVFLGDFVISKNLSSPSITIDRLNNGVEYSIGITAVNYSGTFGQYVERPRIEPLRSTTLRVTGTPTA